MKKITLIFTTVLAILLLGSCTSNQEKMENRMKAFISGYEAKAIPLYRASALASWNANITGSDQDFATSEKASFDYAKIFTDSIAFAGLKEIRESQGMKDPILLRELELLYNGYLGGQIDTALLAAQIKMETEISKKYANFRVTLNGKQVSDNEVEVILKNATDNNELKAAWEGSKLIGPVVADDVIKLVKHRNTIARKIGFSNFHEMSLRLSGQDPADVTKIFDELDSLTGKSFAGLKGEIDAFYAKRYKIKDSELKPWHYQNRFFQEAPELYPTNLDKYYSNQDPVKLASAFYGGIGLSVEAILSKSDLYEKHGKNQHAFCTDIDRSGDVRALLNIRPDSYWMNTILHELGHGVYSYYNDPTLPFTLRDAAHTFTTEAIAEFFGRLAKDPQWMMSMGIINKEESEKISEDCSKSQRLQMLVFSRWAQVMYRFEKSMYENPDQDLNNLWWTIVEKYQLMSKPEGRNMPDWATKIHIALYPCYYHNYLLGELMASQLHYYILDNITQNQSLSGNKAVGDYLKEKIFMPGAKYYWNDMIEKATGEKLTAKYYARQFVQ